MTQSYTAQLTRDGKWWAVYVPEIDRSTQGRTIAEADEMARDLISIMLSDQAEGSIDPDSFDVKIDIRLPENVQASLEKAEQFRKQAQLDQQAALSEQASAVRSLLKAGLSMRDAARALGISHQRVGQLAHL